MATPAAPTSTSTRAVVSRHAAGLKDALRSARSRTHMKQTDEYSRSVAKKVLSSTESKAVEHVMTLVIDLAQRGSLEDAESIGLSLAAIARAEYSVAHPDAARQLPTRDEAAMAEEEAQGVRELAEKAMDLDPRNVSKRLAFLAASARYSQAARTLDEVVRNELAVEPRVTP